MDEPLQKPSGSNGQLPNPSQAAFKISNGQNLRYSTKEMVGEGKNRRASAAMGHGLTSEAPCYTFSKASEL